MSVSPYAPSFYALLRWRQKLEAAGFVVTDAPWFPGANTPPSPARDGIGTYEVWTTYGRRS